ncbi:sporulation protein rmd1 [Ophiostoma piceae UAMH 11346]|uniref:Sporulation protein rmd1 n=1 Tax=Ophiostoma piceae (strain UAMH 11346) TaxID=1262450 RepID=S3CE60_OPHP1|nr:sporulation protein rmd1 [Ophiostoma piceae UAMH 11346]
MAEPAAHEPSESSPLLQTATPPQTTDRPTKGSGPPASPSALARPNPDGRPKPSRNVTFDPNPVSRTIEASPANSPPVQSPLQQPLRNRGTASTSPVFTPTPLSYGTTSAVSSGRSVVGGAPTGPGAGAVGGVSGGAPPVLTAINNRLRRRNSHGSAPMQQLQAHAPKIGPQRSTKNAQKLKLLPNPDFGEEGPDEESGRDVYSQYTRIKDPTARRDAALLGKSDRARLPRVTAYCTANRYEMEGLMRFLKGRGRTRGGNPKLIDECIYTPYDYDFVKNGDSFEANGSSSRRRRARSRVNNHSYIGGGGNFGSERGAQQEAAEETEAQRPQFQEPQQDVQEQTELTESTESTENDALLPPSSYYQERRHSAGEVDADYTPQRPDELTDLDGNGDESQGSSHRDTAIDEVMHDHSQNIDDSVYGNGQQHSGDYYGDNRGQQQQQHESQHHIHQIHRHQRQAEEAVMDLLNGDELDRQAVGDNPLQLRDEFEQQLRGERPVDFDTKVHTPEVFLFDYGVVVIWGMSELQEQRFLKELAKFELGKLGVDDVEAEFFNFYYTREYQARIYNDFIALSDKNNYMTKLAISHALAQSVKTSLFEELIASTIDTCKDIPTQIAMTGKINLTRSQINMQIGELFILRINIHLNGSVLDTPELFWVEPLLEPVYQAVRSYLEMDQRVGLLTQRLDVIADLLAVLKEQLSHGHGEKLEWIVIILIAAEILVAAINIVVDLYAGG